jgi:cytochrome b
MDHAHVAASQADGADQAADRQDTTWDLPLRLFHWSMAGCVVVALVTGFLAPPWWLDVHVYAGYGLCLLLGFRLVWGLVGSRASRFDNFPLSVSDLRRFLTKLRTGAMPPPAGHNPVGAWMILLLLALLTVRAASGLVVLGGQEKQGPLGGLIQFQSTQAVKQIHEIAAWALCGAVGVHLAGVAAHDEMLFKHPVLRRMIAGHGGGGRGATMFGGGIFAALAVALTGAGVLLAAAGAPSPALRFPPLYQSECGACHAVYHPSLRLGATWKRLMDGLSDHYGEEVILGDEAAAAIAMFLESNGAEHFDTEISWRIGRENTESMRMTDTPYWKRRHRDIPNVLFRWRTVGAKINCDGCHGDAATGEYADQRIGLPKGAPR